MLNIILQFVILFGLQFFIYIKLYKNEPYTYQMWYFLISAAVQHFFLCFAYFCNIKEFLSGWAINLVISFSFILYIMLNRNKIQAQEQEQHVE